MSITIDHIREAGVVGAGGAGFPTHVKLAAEADTVVLNAAECEPLLHKDKELLRRFGQTVVDGVAVAMQSVGASRGVIGVKGKYADVIDTVRPLLGKGMEICPLDDAYPSGDEFILVYEALGRVIPPGGIPLHVGAVVMNVETAYNVARSDTQPVTEKFVSVAGDVKRPITVRVPVGTPLSACVELAGGPTISDPNYVVGGLMMGYLETNHDIPVTKTTGGVIVLPTDHIAVRRRQMDWKQIAAIGRGACDQCSFCTELCPRNLLGHPIEPHRAMRSLGFNMVGEANTLGTQFCSECGLCTFYACPESLDPRGVCVQNKQRLMAEKQRWENPPFRSERPALHMNNRKAPTARLMQRLGVRNYDNTGPLVEETVAPKSVAIALHQHIGAPCDPMVSVGDTVARGQTIGRPPVKDGNPALGAPVHASIDGRVTRIADGHIIIESK